MKHKRGIFIRHARLPEESLLDSVHGFQYRTRSVMDCRGAVLNVRQELRLIPQHAPRYIVVPAAPKQGCQLPGTVFPDEQRINPSGFAACMPALSPDARRIRQDDLRAQARGPHRTSHAPRQADYRTAAQPRGAGCRKRA